MRAPIQDIRRGWACLATAVILVCAAGAQDNIALTPTNAKVEVSTISQKDPHPTTYSWDAPVVTITKPGNEYFAWYYTGTVQPDARVPDGSPIMRIPVKMKDWAQNKRWIIAQLTLFYQQANRLPPTALQDYQAGPNAPNANLLMPQPTPMMTPPPRPMPTGNDEPAENNYGTEGAEVENPDLGSEAPPPGPGQMNMGGGPANFQAPNAFDPKAAAEWTFYYDQLVLWQYYCARTLLNGQDKNLLEQMPSRTPQQQGQQQLLTQISGMTPQMLRRTTLQEARRQTQGNNGQPGSPQDMAQFNSQYIGDGADMENPDLGGGGEMGMGGGMGMGMGGPNQQITVLRERFDPTKDYNSLSDGSKSKGDEYRDKFLEAAKQLDDQVYTLYMDMIKGIDKRQANNEEYEKWIKDKRQEVSGYAETWRKLEHGETIMIDGTMFLVSKDPLESVPNQSINIIKRERLTPADLLNPDGTVRTAK